VPEAPTAGKEDIQNKMPIVGGRNGSKCTNKEVSRSVKSSLPYTSSSIATARYISSGHTLNSNPSALCRYRSQMLEGSHIGEFPAHSVIKGNLDAIDTLSSTGISIPSYSIGWLALIGPLCSLGRKRQDFVVVGHSDCTVHV
jgi:hypothetical protein